MKKYQSIQYLRAIAALMVVFHHARNPRAGLYDPLENFGAGQAGVDIFFVISGFIMYSAARQEAPLDFVRRRCARVVPMYWIATLVFLFMSVEIGHHRHAFSQSIGVNVVKSLLFIPHYNLDYSDEIWPYLIPGWTLNFEMFFYVVFALALAARRIVPVLAALLAGLVGLGLLIKSDNPFWATYTNPLLLEFLAGVVIAKRSDRALPLRWALLLPAGFVVIGLSALINAPRVVIWGVPAAMVVMGAIALEHNGRLPDWKLLGIVGDASYSIYLFQTIALGGVGAFMLRVPLAGPVQWMLSVAIGLALATGLGLAVYYVLERPITRQLSGPRPPERVGDLATP